jgi:cobyrinic acid a,c-diamide synthase
MTCIRPRVMIAGERSGVGKSTVTIGLISSFRDRGLAVQPFKTGPDFLDPMHHNAVSSRISRNLDTWMIPDYVKRSFVSNSKGADLSLVEGVMGFYDGYDGLSEEGSSAHLSKVLDCPVVLILNASASARSLGAVAKGFVDYDPNVNIAGVIFNNVGGKRHLNMLEASLRGVECLGGLPLAEDAGLKSRHLGLVPAGEEDNSLSYERIADLMEEHLDIDRIIEIARQAPPFDGEEETSRPIKVRRCRIGLAKDAAFNFYYQDNLDMLTANGAEIVPFSPLEDNMPDVDGVYFGGGYPEMFAERLGQNHEMMSGLRKLASNGMPVYAECGGLMYMCRSMRDLQGAEHGMASLFDAKVEMTESLQSLGYVEAKALRDTILTKKGRTLRGHVFHYSHVTECGEKDFAYSLDKDKGIKDSLDGMASANVLASYTHLHFGTDERVASSFVDACSDYARR